MSDLSGIKGAQGAAARRATMLKTAFGPVIGAALEDPSVTEISVNPCGALWIERRGSVRTIEGERFRPRDVERIIRLVASQAGFDCGPSNPLLSAELPETGERFEGVLPPVAQAPAFAIRKPFATSICIEDYVNDGVLSERQALILKNAVRRRENVLIAGGASSGKTTLANALLAEIASLDERIIILEDTRELRCAARDCVSLRTSPAASLEALVRSTMRLRPDRIIVGEVRGGEALDLLKAWNTGHPGGVATLHANTAASALTRLEQLIGERTMLPSRALIADAIDLVVYISRTAEGRRVEEILRVEGVCERQGYLLSPAKTLSLVT